jgi:hypothetical protein
VSVAEWRVLATLYAVCVSETPYGGQARTYELLGQIWLNPGKVGGRRRNGPDGQQRVETRRVTAGLDPRLNAGRVLEGEVGEALDADSPAPLRLAVMMLTLIAYERGLGEVSSAAVEAWIAPYRTVRL